MEKFTAQEAFNLAKSKEQPIESILESIKNQAGYGYRYLLFPYLSDEKTIELINLGYTVTKHIDPLGIEQTKIKW